MRRTFILFFIFWPFLGYSQNYFKLSGNIGHPIQDFVGFTLYTDWVSEPQYYELPLNLHEFFLVEIPLLEIAYCGLSFGEYSLDLMQIEPGDEISLSFDNEDFYNSLNVSGKGSEKWEMQITLKERFEILKNRDLELYNKRYFPYSDFSSLVAEVTDEQIAVLNTAKSHLSDEAFSLQKADIIGKYKLKELGNLLYHKLPIENLNLEEFPQDLKTETESIYWSQLMDAIINLEVQIQPDAKSIRKEYDQIKTLFPKINKVSIDRYLANFLLTRLKSNELNSELQYLIEDYGFYADNEHYKKIILRQLRKAAILEVGRYAPELIVKNKNNRYVDIKEFRGKYVILGFYDLDCFECDDDMKALGVVNNFFKKQKRRDIDFVMINVSAFDDYKSFLKQDKPFGLHLNGFKNESVTRGYDTDFLPNYLILDKSGRILANDIEKPHMDNGRSLIDLLERNFVKK